MKTSNSCFHFFFSSASNNEQDLFNILGSMYMAVIFLGINNSSTVLPYVVTERSVLYRERFAGMYSSKAYSFAQVHTLYLKQLSCVFDFVTIIS